MDRIITGLLKWTSMGILLHETGMLPLEYLVDLTSQRYGIPILLSPDDHACKHKLLEFIKEITTPAKPGAGLRQITNRVLDLIGTGDPLEATTHQQESPMGAPEIEQSSNEDEALKHKE